MRMKHTAVSLLLKRVAALLIFGLFVAIASAALIPSGGKIESLLDFYGGLNTTDPSHKLSNNYSPFMRNVFIDNSRIETVPGFIVLGSTATLGKITGITPFVRENGQTTFIVTDSSVTLDTPDFLTWVFVSSASNNGAILAWLQVRNKMWGFNGVDFVKTWDGTNRQVLDGTKGLPSVPKFKYAAYDQDRVWGFNIAGAASDLYFSAVVTTSADIIAPDDPRAWPSSQVLHIGQGDGTIGTAEFVYGGRLRCGKEHSIYTIYGDNPSNYKPVKEAANIGVASDESVVVLDENAYLLNNDGIYRNAERISDLIQPDVKTFNTGATNIVQDSWDTQSDFGTKGQFWGSTATPAGILQPITTTYGSIIANQAANGDFNNYILPLSILDGDIPDNSVLSPGTTFFGPKRITYSNAQLPFYGRFYINKLLMGTQPVSPQGCVTFASVTIINTFTGEIQKSTATDFTNSVVNASFSYTNPIWEGYDLQNSSLSIKIEGCNLAIQPFLTNLYVSFKNATTVQFLSTVSTYSMVTAWGNFDSVRNTNGGNINYFVRTSTSAVNISTQVWRSVAPGSVLSDPTINNYVQWASTIQSVSSMTNVSNIDNVTITHIEGAASINRAIAMDWANRYWLSVSTIADSSKREIYVKSMITNKVQNAWMPIDGMDICAFGRTNTRFYGGSCTAGTVYRLDYGTNFNGKAINSIYDTPDMVLGDNYIDKFINKYLLDGEKVSGGTINLGSSVNQSNYTNTTYSIDGSGRYTQIIEGVTGKVKTLRLRLSNSQLDKSMMLNGISVIYSPTEVLSNK